jgi:hypothetical protein
MAGGFQPFFIIPLLRQDSILNSTPTTSNNSSFHAKSKAFFPFFMMLILPGYKSKNTHRMQPSV